MFIKRTLAAGGFVLASVAAASAANLSVMGGRTGRASSGTGLQLSWTLCRRIWWIHIRTCWRRRSPSRLQFRERWLCRRGRSASRRRVCWSGILHHRRRTCWLPRGRTCSSVRRGRCGLPPRYSGVLLHRRRRHGGRGWNEFVIVRRGQSAGRVWWRLLPSDDPSRVQLAPLGTHSLRFGTTRALQWMAESRGDGAVECWLTLDRWLDLLLLGLRRYCGRPKELPLTACSFL